LNPEWLKVRVASRAPSASGVKVIVTVQLEEEARLEPQFSLEIAKSSGLVPEIPILLIEISEVPMLLKVTTFGVPVEPKGTLPQTTLLGSIRTPLTKQPVKVRTKRKIVARSKLTARFLLTVHRCFAFAVKVISSGFILLGGNRISPGRGQETTKQQRRAYKDKVCFPSHSVSGCFVAEGVRSS